MRRILVIGGVTEGRQIAEYLAEEGRDVLVSVASALGASYLQGDKKFAVHMGRIPEEQMALFLVEQGISLAVDASHPYAVEISKNCMAACKQIGIPYVRYERPEGDWKGDVLFFDGYPQAVEFLAKGQGKVLITTGIRHLEEYTALPEYQDRAVVRALPTEEAKSKCRALGFLAEQVVYQAPPYTDEGLLELIQNYSVQAVVTKDGGAAGGIGQKIAVCMEKKIPLLVIKRPAIPYPVCFSGIEEVLSYCREVLP